MSHRPAVVGAVLLVALLVPVAGIPAMRTNFDALTDLPRTSDARAGFDLVAQHLGKGRIMPVNGVIEAGSGTDLLAPAALGQLRDVTQALVKTPGVQSVTSLIAPTGNGSVPDAFVPSRQLESMASGFASSGGGPQALLDPKVTDRAPVGAPTTWARSRRRSRASRPRRRTRTAEADLGAAPGLIVQLRQSALVSTQLRSLSTALQAPAVPGADPRAALQAVGAYLQDLAAAYPTTASLPAFTRAQSDLATLQQAPTPAAVGDLATALGSLATTFDAQPDAVLFPQSLPASAQSTALQGQIAAVFGRLPGDLRTLAQQYAALPDDLFIPTTLGGQSGAQVQSAVAAFLSTGGNITRLFIITSDDPYSDRRVRHGPARAGGARPGRLPVRAGAQAYIGGPTAELADMQTALDTDFQRVAVITVLGRVPGAGPAAAGDRGAALPGADGPAVVPEHAGPHLLALPVGARTSPGSASSCR